MQIPQDLVANWDAFIAECCEGSVPSESPDDVRSAISAVRRLWPEYLDEMESLGTGPAMAAPLIALGLDLARCEHRAGFAAILTRLRGGEEPARAEIEVASAFASRGLDFDLEPPLNGKTLDSVVRIDGVNVYVEVIAPETSDAMAQTYQALKEVAVAVVQRRAGVHVDLRLDAEPEASLHRVIAAVDALPADGWIRRVTDLGLACATPSRIGPLTIPPRIESDGKAPMLYNFHARVEASLNTSATVAHPMRDERVKSLLYKELKHFTKSECNALVVCVTNVPGGLTWWGEFVQRWFQPDQNTRIGAVILYDSATIGTPMGVHRRWRVFENPHAVRPLPAAFLAATRALDDEQNEP